MNIILFLFLHLFHYSIKLEIQKNQDVSFTPLHPSAIDQALFQVWAQLWFQKYT